MKYLTKEWKQARMVIHLYEQLRISRKAEKKDKSLFEGIYKEKSHRYLRYEKSRRIFHNPKEDLQKIDDYIGEPNISEEERKRREEYKRNYIYLNQERIESGKYYGFDEKKGMRLFNEELKYKIETCRKILSKEILEEIADIRVFVLGKTSRKVKEKLLPYIKELKKDSRERLREARRQTRAAERKLKQNLGVNEYEELILSGISQRQGNVYMKFEMGGLCFTEGEIIERENGRIHRWNPNIPYSGLTQVVAGELYYRKKRFELHCLIESTDANNKTKLWYKQERLIKIADGWGGSRYYNFDRSETFQMAVINVYK